jgi:hypothetical protein
LHFIKRKIAKLLSKEKPGGIVRVLYDPLTQKSILLTEERLRIYKRLLLLNEDSGPPHYMQKELAKLFKDYLENKELSTGFGTGLSAYDKLEEVGFVRDSDLKWPHTYIVDIELADFVITKVMSNELFHKVAEIKLNTNIQEGEKSPEGKIDNLKQIAPEGNNNNNCLIM